MGSSALRSLAGPPVRSLLSSIATAGAYCPELSWRPRASGRSCAPQRPRAKWNVRPTELPARAKFGYVHEAVKVAPPMRHIAILAAAIAAGALAGGVLHAAQRLPPGLPPS